MADATIIMAGGSGTRLWPASLSSHPKQLLRVGGKKSLIQHAFVRAAAACDGPILVVTNHAHVEPIARHAAELDAGELPGLRKRLVYLPEPTGRNTAPAIAFGMAYLRQALGADKTALILTADHLIEPLDAFAADAARASTLASAGHLVCFGIRPLRPETGFGYIEVGDPVDGGRKIVAFREKPDTETAERYLAGGRHYWNSGMFAFSGQAFWVELSQHHPQIAEAWTGAGSILQSSERSDGSRETDPEALEPLYTELPKISIDYALMEKSPLGAVVPASFRWSDVGSWDEVAGVSDAAFAARGKPDGGGPEPIILEGSGVHVHSDLPVAVCGLSDVHVIVKNGKVLVCKRGESQLVKHVVETAQSRGDDTFLE